MCCGPSLEPLLPLTVTTSITIRTSFLIFSAHSLSLPLLLSLPLGPWLSKMTADTNIGALDAALDAAITYVDLAPVDTVKNYAAGEDSKVFLNAVDKTFSGKSSTVIK